MKNMWKRSLSLFLAIVMVMGMIPMSVFAEEGDVCVHENVETRTQDATCTEQGLWQAVCVDCGSVVSEEPLNAAGHSWDGNTCTVCGETQTVEAPEEEIPEEVIPEEEVPEEVIPEEEVPEEVVPEEEVPEEVVPEEEIPEEVIPEVEIFEEEPVLFAARANALVGDIWLDKSRDSDLMTKVMEGGLRDMVLAAVNMEDATGKVYYNSADGSKADVTVLTDLMGMYEELKDVLTGQADLYFTIGSGASAKEAKITFRNIDHLKFEISVPAVRSKNEPANLAAAIRSALEDAAITVTHGDDEIDWESMSDSLFSVEYDIPENVTWPAPGKSAECDASITVSICDSVDGTTVESGIAYVTLVDTTPTYTVNFWSNGAIWRQFKVLEGQKLPVDVNTLKPALTYHSFMGWDQTVETTVNGNADYTAKWEIDPNFDKNGNGIVDNTEFFVVKYLLEEGDAKAYATFNPRYGTKTPIPETTPSKEGSIFLGWVPEGSTAGDAVIAETVTDHATYVAKWAEQAEEFVVTYIKNRIGGGAETFTLVTDGGKAEYFDYTVGKQTWDGWYVADAEGKATEVKFDFDKKVDDQGIDDAYLEDNRLTLVGTLGVDAGGAAGIDGTAADPYTKYVFQVKDADGEWEDYHMPPASYDHDENTHVDITDLDEYFDPNDDLQNDVIHSGWEKIESTGGDYSKTEVLQPTYLPDVNNNDVKDEAEGAKIVLQEGDTVKEAGSLKATGKVTMELGTVEIPGLNEDGTFLCNSNGLATGNKNGVVTTIVAKPTPGKNSYVSKILVNGEEQELHELEGVPGAYYINLHEAQTAAVAMLAAGEAYTVEVIFETAEIKFKETPDAGVLIPGKTYTTDDVAAVYDAVVDSPERKGNAKVSVEYVARAEDTVTVSIKALREDIVFRYGKLGQKVIDTVWPGDTVTVKMDEVTKPITYQHTGMVRTPQQVVDGYILELQSADITNLMGVLATLEQTIQSKVKSSANVHSFLYNANGNTFEETVIVNYKEGKRDMTGRKTYTLEDGRPATTITAGNKTVTAGKYTDKDLLSGVTLNGASGEVKLADSFAGRNARVYKNVPVYFAGNEASKPSQATFDLTIQKGKINKLVVDNVIVEKHNDIYNAAPVIDPANVDVISVVAGLDLNKLDLDLSVANPYANLKNVDAKAWIKVPENLKSVLKLLDIDTSISRTYTLAELEKKLTDNADTLEQFGVPKKAINAIIKVLNKVNDYAEATLGMEIIFTDDVYPTNPGVYVHLAVSADPNYESAMDYGSILIAPVVALPNRGGVQLVYDGLAENLFALTNDGKAKTLQVTYNGDPVTADVYYYGFNAEAAVHSKKVAPSVPGVYLATTIYTAADEDGQIKKLGSDAALLVIGMTDVQLDIAREIVVAEEGKKFRPAVTVTKNDGTVVNDAAVTIISGTVNMADEEDVDLDDLGAAVNIEFPNAVHTAWKKFFHTLNEQDKVNLPNVNENLSECKITPDTLIRFLNWCSAEIDREFPSEQLKKLSIPERYVDKAADLSKATINKLISAANKLVAAAKKLPDGIMTITFEQNKHYEDNGVYLYFGVVTDPDYIPDANAGLLVIKADEKDLVLFDTHTPYNGEGQQPAGWDYTNREGITMVVDRSAKTVNFIMDDDMNAAINTFEKETGFNLNGKTVSDLYAGSVNKAEKLVAAICNAIQKKAIDRIPSGTAQEEIKKLTDILDNKLGILRDKLEAKLVELKNSNVKIIINGELPKNVGTYEFYAYSYAIEVARANLYIEPIHVRVTANNLTKVYDGKDGVENLDIDVSYFSYASVEGQPLKEVEITTLPDGITEESLGLKYSSSCTGKNVGTYPIKIFNASITKTANFADKVDVVNGELEITPREVEVVVSNAEKVFGNAEPEYEYEVKNVVQGEELTFEVSREAGEDVGVYDLTAKLAKENTNYVVTGETHGKLTITEAKINIVIKNAEKVINAEENLDFEYEVIIEEGLGAYTEEQKQAFIDSLKIVIERTYDEDDDNLGDEFALSAKHVNNDEDEGNDNLNVVINANTDAKLTITLGDYVCWNMQTGVYYDDVGVGLTAAAAGETVQMLKNDVCDEMLLWVKPGTTLDLNDLVVEAEFVVGLNGSHIVNASSNRAGLLKVVRDNISLSVSNKETPVLDDALGGYRFGSYYVNDTDSGLGFTESDGTIFYTFVAKQSGKLKDYFLDGVSDNDIQVIVKATWKEETGDRSHIFVYNDTQVGLVANGGKMFTFTMTEYEALSELKINAMITTDSRVENSTAIHDVT